MSEYQLTSGTGNARKEPIECLVKGGKGIICVNIGKIFEIGLEFEWEQRSIVDS